MAVKPFKILSDLQTNKQIIKVDKAADDAVLFNVSGTLADGGHVSSSFAYTGSGLFVDGDAVVKGRLTVREYYSEQVTASIIYESGSTKFGNTLDDTHQFTGSVSISGGFSAHYLTASLGLYSGGPSELNGAVTANNGLTILGAALDASVVAVSASALNVSTTATVGLLSSSTAVVAPLGMFATSSTATTASFNSITVLTASQVINGVSYDVYSIDQALHAVDDALADKTKILNAYKRLRFQTSGTFDPSGIQLVALPTASLNGEAFPISSLPYIAFDVMFKLEASDNWMNDVAAIEVYVTGASGSEYIEVAINTAEIPYAYRLVAVNEDPSKYVV
jgi:hypothetical protein